MQLGANVLCPLSSCDFLRGFLSIYPALSHDAVVIITWRSRAPSSNCLFSNLQSKPQRLEYNLNKLLETVLIVEYDSVDCLSYMGSSLISCSPVEHLLHDTSQRSRISVLFYSLRMPRMKECRRSECCNWPSSHRQELNFGMFLEMKTLKLFITHILLLRCFAACDPHRGPENWILSGFQVS